ncbi:MAG: lipocalin-like domain-containing protein [Proteobacteria bacterium]|nr:lipocalin-like domain-containing protein [Pseudomonadota bacterium]
MKYSPLIYFALSLLVSPLVAYGSDARFVGTWELVSIESKTETGDWVLADLPLSGSPVGIIMYDDNGNMAVQITSSPRGTETPAEQPEIINGYVAYYAKYEVDPVAGTVTHHRRNHVNPELSKLSVVRYFYFNDNDLTLTFAPGRTLRLNWTRVE